MKIVTRFFLFSLSLLGFQFGAFCEAQASLNCDTVFAANEKISTVAKVSIWATSASFVMMPLATLAGGFSGTGGGSGVLIFKESSDVERAQNLVNAGEAIPADLLSRGHVVVLEKFEMDSTGQKALTFGRDATREVIVREAVEILELISPIVAGQLRKILPSIQPKGWSPKPELPLFKDANPLRPTEGVGARVQIAIRTSAGNNIHGNGPPAGPLELRIDYNQLLFEHLDPLNQAMLIVHEGLYALAQASGHSDSNQVRSVVREIFGRSLQVQKSEIKNSGVLLHATVAALRDKLIDVFGDYTVYFSRVGDSETVDARISQRHAEVFSELVHEMRERDLKYRIQGYSRAASRRMMMTDLATTGNLSDEASFLFLTYFHLQTQLKKINAEWLMRSDLSNYESREAMLLVCHQLIESNSSVLSSTFNHMKMKALRYCHALL